MIEETIAQIIMAIYFAVALGIGVFVRRVAERSPDEFWKAAGRLSLFPLTFSIWTLYVSGAGTIGIPGITWRLGLQFTAAIASICIMTYVMPIILVSNAFEKTWSVYSSGFPC
ncbi:MAG: hypothetical protein QXH24_02645 [Candidatus Bathyarchaeia archaeon]